MNPIVTLGIGILIGVQYERRRSLQDAQALAEEAVREAQSDSMQGQSARRRRLRSRRRKLRRRRQWLRNLRRDARRADMPGPICGLPESSPVQLRSNDPAAVAAQLYA